jgi:urea transport system substrate-binding protein
MNMSRRRTLAGLTGLASSLTLPRAAYPAPPITIGILHSLTGTMALSERTLRDVMLMLIAEQNERGGLLGRRLEPIVLDPASDWPRFTAMARELIVRHEVAAIFGCWTSASRKAVLPVVKELNSILYYPVQYEGEESERHVFYLGAAPNQQAIPAIDFLMRHSGDFIRRWVLIGTDYVYPRTTNRILQAYLAQRGVAPDDIKVIYTPFGHADWSAIVAELKAYGRGKPTAVISTVNGDANVFFYRELARQRVDAREIPVMAFSVGEGELVGIDTAPLVGHLAAWNYFQSVPTERNNDFVRRWRAFTGSAERPVTDPMEAHMIGFQMWCTAVTRAQTTATDAVIAAMVGLEVPNLSGGIARMLPNHHLTKPVMIGEIQPDGQFEIVWRSPQLVPGDAWSDHLAESRRLEADWSVRNCGRIDTATGRCMDT